MRTIGFAKGTPLAARSSDRLYIAQVGTTETYGVAIAPLLPTPVRGARREALAAFARRVKPLSLLAKRQGSN